MALTGFDGLASCVHCGFCLPACPTYEVTADESDSPRGRIVLMRALATEAMPPDDVALVAHLDRCLGCRACETVCPSGVAYGPALEAARAHIRQVRPLPPVMRLALWVLATPGRQRWLWWLARGLRATGLPERLARGAGRDAPRLANALAMLAATAPAGPPRRRAPRAVAAGADAARAVLFTGCVMDGLFGHVHDATVDALAANGVSVTRTPDQVCCGALAAHAGDDDLARTLAMRNVAAFAADPDATIVVNSAGCGAMLKAYGAWLAGTPLATQALAVAARVRDVSEVLADRGPAPGRAAVPLHVAADAPCHLLHAQQVAHQPGRVLDAVPGLTRAPLEGSDRCCGSAGLYALVEPALAGDVLALKLDAIARSGAEVVTTGNPGCLMHIGAGLLQRGAATRVVHPVELLARAYEA